MGKKVVKLEAPVELSLVMLEPSIAIVSKNLTKEDARLVFASSVLLALTTEHGDLGGRQDEKIVKETLRLTNLMVDAYFNT